MQVILWDVWRFTSLEEVHWFPPLHVGRHRQGCCDVTWQTVKTCAGSLGVSRVHYIIFKAPVGTILQKHVLIQNRFHNGLQRQTYEALLNDLMYFSSMLINNIILPVELHNPPTHTQFLHGKVKQLLSITTANAMEIKMTNWNQPWSAKALWGGTGSYRAYWCMMPYLQEVCLSLAVAAGEDSVYGRGDSPYVCDAPRWTWNFPGIQHPEVMACGDKPRANHPCMDSKMRCSNL